MMKACTTNGISKRASEIERKRPCVYTAQINYTAQFMLFTGDELKLGTALTFKSAYLAALENDLGPVSLR